MNYQDMNANAQGGQQPVPNPNADHTPQPANPYATPNYQQQATPAGNYQPPTGYGPPPNYNGQTYGTPPYQQPYNQQYTQPNTTAGASLTTLPSNILAALSYVFLWAGAIVCLVIRKRDHFVSFHAMQSLLFFGTLTILRIVLPVFYYSINNPITDALLPVLWNLVVLVGTIGWIVLGIMAYQSKYVKLPIIGDFAQRYADKNAGVQR